MDTTAREETVATPFLAAEYALFSAAANKDVRKVGKVYVRYLPAIRVRTV